MEKQSRTRTMVFWTLVALVVVGIVLNVYLFMNDPVRNKQPAWYSCEGLILGGVDRGVYALAPPIKFCNATASGELTCTPVVLTQNQSFIDVPYYCERLKNFKPSLNKFEQKK